MARFRVSLEIEAETFAEAEEKDAAGERSVKDQPLKDMPEKDDLAYEIENTIKGAVTGRGWLVESFDTIY